MVFNHKAYEELFPRKDKQPKQKTAVKKPEMGNVLEEAEEAEQAPGDPDPDAPEDDDPDEGGESDGNE